jgi:hypothetical protein
LIMRACTDAGQSRSRRIYVIKKIGLGCVLMVALALPASASADQSPSNLEKAAKHCKTLRAEMGRDDFRAEFGSKRNGRHAFARCIAKRGKAKRRLVAAAMRECKAEFAVDPVAFVEKYGKDGGAEASRDHPGERPGSGELPKRGERPEQGKRPGEEGRPDKRQGEARKAFHRCVRLKIEELTAERREALKNAAKECKAEFRADPDAFEQKYGSNRNKRNAFGKCVSQKARAGRPKPEDEAPKNEAPADEVPAKD